MVWVSFLSTKKIDPLTSWVKLAKDNSKAAVNWALNTSFVNTDKGKSQLRNENSSRKLNVGLDSVLENVVKT